MLELIAIQKSFAGVLAVDSLSLTVERGQVVGLLGPNGAGKTTTMRMIASLVEPDSGHILFDGIDIQRDPRAVKRRLGFMPENNPLYEDMLTVEYLEYIASLKGLRGKERKSAIETAVAETGIQEVYFRPIRELSKGYKQRVGLAQAIMHTPDLLILDEPQEGLDPNQRMEIRKLITELGKERTVLISTHVLQEVTATCTRAVIIHRGRVVADGAVDSLIRDATSTRRVVLEAEGLRDTRQLEEILGITQVVEIGGQPRGDRRIYELHIQSGTDPRADVFDAAKAQGWRIWDLHQEQVKLEDVFRQLTK